MVNMVKMLMVWMKVVVVVNRMTKVYDDER